MGFDLNGLSPTTESGEYFRNNIWSWPALWSLVCHCCDDILTAEQMERGFTNDGVIIEAWQAQLIAERLRGLPEGAKSEVVLPQEQQAHLAMWKICSAVGAPCMISGTTLRRLPTLLAKAVDILYF